MPLNHLVIFVARPQITLSLQRATRRTTTAGVDEDDNQDEGAVSIRGMLGIWGIHVNAPRESEGGRNVTRRRRRRPRTWEFCVGGVSGWGCFSFRVYTFRHFLRSVYFYLIFFASLRRSAPRHGQNKTINSRQTECRALNFWGFARIPSMALCKFNASRFCGEGKFFQQTGWIIIWWSRSVGRFCVSERTHQGNSQ